MIRTLLALFALAALAWISVLVADHPGKIVVQWDIYTATLSVGQAFLFLLLFGFGFAISLRLVWFLFSSVRLARRHAARRQLRKGIEAAGQGFVALASGNAHAAARQARRARRHAPEQPLTLLLSAQTAQLQGRDSEAASYFRKMLEREDMAFVGATGLWAQARRQDDPGAALAHAGQAYTLNPRSERAARAYIEALMRAGEWREAQIIAFRAQNDRVIEKQAAIRLRQAALIGRSRTATTPADALTFAHEAWRIDHSFTPAVLAYAERLLASQPTKARRVVEKGWLQTHDILLLRAWREAFSSDLPHEKRAARAETLARVAPDAPEVRLTRATTLMQAGKPAEARPILLALEKTAPSALVYEELAALTRQETNDTALIEDWLDKAANAPDLPCWTCTSCGATTTVWEALCPSCYGLLTLETAPTSGAALSPNLPVSLAATQP
jgi:HemY protein